MSPYAACFMTLVYFLLLVIGTKVLTHMPSKLPLPMVCITNSVPKDKRTSGYLLAY